MLWEVGKGRMVIEEDGFFWGMQVFFWGFGGFGERGGEVWMSFV